jgi:DNA polymerase III delta' subunit
MTSSSHFNLIGHQNRFTVLARAAMDGRVPQTLLISGEPHLGKSTFARYFAQLLLCENPLKSDGDEATYLPCGTCLSCHQVEIGAHPDYSVFRPQVSSSATTASGTAPTDLVSSIIGVGQAREFSLKAQTSPINGPRKVMVMEQADRMNTEAQNALLKTFEEPARGLTIVLLCDNASVLLPTVRSRCWEIRLGLVDDAQIVDWLKSQDEHSDEKTIELALRAARGRPGLAWREAQRARNGEESLPRLAQMEQWVDQFTQSLPVAALKFSSEAQKLALQWWEEDLALENSDDFNLKGADSKVARSAVAHFLDLLMAVYRVRWRQQAASANAIIWAAGLDQIRDTRHYILRNANTALALDVLFSRLLSDYRVH